MKIEVKPWTRPIINSIWILREKEDMILLEMDFKEKWAEVKYYTGCEERAIIICFGPPETEDGFGEEVIITDVPWEFLNITHCNRYTGHILLYKRPQPEEYYMDNMKFLYDRGEA